MFKGAIAPFFSAFSFEQLIYLYRFSIVSCNVGMLFAKKQVRNRALICSSKTQFFSCRKRCWYRLSWTGSWLVKPRDKAILDNGKSFIEVDTQRLQQGEMIPTAPPNTAGCQESR
jgi:hypothetical protein